MKIAEIEEKYRDRLMAVFEEMYEETEGMLSAIAVMEEDEIGAGIGIEFFYRQYEGELN